MTFAFQYSGVFSSQPTAHASSGEIATVPHPVADESIMMSSSSAGNPAFAFDPPQDSDSLPADTLAFTLNDDDSIPLDNFFTAGAEDLPELTLPGCGAEDSKELFGNSDTDMTAAAGCSVIAGNAGSGSNEYDDNAGSLLGGVERLGSLGTDQWGGEATLRVVGLKAADNADIEDGASGPGVPGDDNALHYQARGVLYLGDDAAADTFSFGVLENGRPVAAAQRDDVFVSPVGGHDNGYGLCAYDSATGRVTYTLTDAGKAALAALPGSQNLYDYVTLTVGGQTYTMQIVVNRNNTFNSAAQDAVDAASGLLNTGGGGILWGERHSGLDHGDNGRYTVSASSGNDEVTFSNASSVAGGAAGRGFTGILRANGGNDAVTISAATEQGNAYGLSGGSTVDGGAGNDKILVNATSGSGNAYGMQADGLSRNLVDGGAGEDAATIAVQSSGGVAYGMDAGNGGGNTVNAERIVMSGSASGVAMNAASGGVNAISQAGSGEVELAWGMRAQGAASVNAITADGPVHVGGSTIVSADKLTAYSDAGMDAMGGATNSIDAHGGAVNLDASMKAAGKDASGVNSKNSISTTGDVVIKGAVYAFEGGQNSIHGDNVTADFVNSLKNVLGAAQANFGARNEIYAINDITMQDTAKSGNYAVHTHDGVNHLEAGNDIILNGAIGSSQSKYAVNEIMAGGDLSVGKSVYGSSLEANDGSSNLVTVGGDMTVAGKMGSNTNGLNQVTFTGGAGSSHTFTLNGDIVTTSANANGNVIIGSDGSEHITLSGQMSGSRVGSGTTASPYGYGVAINTGSGNDTVSIAKGASGSSIILGLGSDDVTIGKAGGGGNLSNSVIATGDSVTGASLTGTGDIDDVTIYGNVSNSFIYGDAGVDTIHITAASGSALSSATIKTGAGDDLVSVTDSSGIGMNTSSLLDLGDGADRAIISGGSGGMSGSTLVAGHGADDITITGNISSSTIALGSLSTGVDALDTDNNRLTVNGLMTGGKIYGTAGEDHVFVNGLASSTVNLGAGDDHMYINGPVSGSAIHGGAGMDVLHLDGAGMLSGGVQTLDFSSLFGSGNTIDGFEEIDLTGLHANLFKISGNGAAMDNALHMDTALDGVKLGADSANQPLAGQQVLRITGDANDTVQLDTAHWNQHPTGTVQYNGVTYNEYISDDSHHLLVQQALQVIFG